jgi:predicted SAM-dependent methyltransferase
MKYLNLGCGSRFHPEFVNIDVAHPSPHVRAYDLTQGVPLPEDTFDLVYHSHLLEHFNREKALDFMKQCYRVLKLHGIIRVVVPDLEQIARTYLASLDQVLQNNEEWEANYDWMMLELYDQTVRAQPGGTMLEYLKQNPVPNEGFVYQRAGGEARRIIRALREPASNNQAGDAKRCHFNGTHSIVRFLREKLLKLLLNDADYRALETGRFRACGEIHQWMYDRYSLARVLKQAGFQHPKVLNANESQIPRWSEYHLDTEPDGSIYKPDSLFMEAVKLESCAIGERRENPT